MMRVTYDEDVDAAYIYLDEEADVARTDAREIAGVGFINLDLDADGRVVGIEVIGARELLPVELLEHAKREDPPEHLSGPGAS